MPVGYAELIANCMNWDDPTARPNFTEIIVQLRALQADPAVAESGEQHMQSVYARR